MENPEKSPFFMVNFPWKITMKPSNRPKLPQHRHHRGTGIPSRLVDAAHVGRLQQRRGAVADHGVDVGARVRQVPDDVGVAAHGGLEGLEHFTTVMMIFHEIYWGYTGDIQII